MSELMTGGHGFYIAASYVACAIVVAAEILALRARRRAAVADAQAATPDPQPPVALGRAGADR